MYKHSGDILTVQLFFADKHCCLVYLRYIAISITSSFLSVKHSGRTRKQTSTLPLVKEISSQQINLLHGREKTDWSGESGMLFVYVIFSFLPFSFVWVLFYNCSLFSSLLDLLTKYILRLSRAIFVASVAQSLSALGCLLWTGAISSFRIYQNWKGHVYTLKHSW